MNSNPELFILTATRLGWAVLHSLWQGALAGLLIAVLLRAMRSRSASARHAVSLCGLLAMGAALVVTVFYSPRPEKMRSSSIALPNSPLVTEAAAPTAAANDTVSLRNEETEGSAVPAASLVSRVLAKPWDAPIAPVIPYISAAWLFGVLMLTVRQCGGWWCVRQWRLAGTASAAEVEHCFARLLDRFGLRHTARVLVSVRAATPMLTGFVKPVVLLPARVLTGLSPAELEAILAHELAHLSRRDSWANLAQVIVETVLFYHPVVWWLGRRAREERENAADDLALGVCTDRRRYAGALARLAEFELEPDLALAATGGSLLARIRRILQKPIPEPAPGLGFTVPVSLAAMLVAALAVSRAATPPPIEVAAGQPLQAAIDAAPAGAVLRLAAGEWKERIFIKKPLTLEGAGWDKTIIKPDQPALDNATLQPRPTPTILVAGANTVTLRGLRIGGVAPASREEAGGHALVMFMKARATMSDCAVVGPIATGILLAAESNVKIERSLIAAMWGNGIVVIGRGRDSERSVSRLHLVESEVRNVYHYGIHLGRGCDDSVIERCRISGAAWHGIRYDDASPTITGNTIFAHARSGIYASGKTAAKVRGNLFWRNEMNGISCWGPNEDTIEENTFAGNLREGLAVIGGGRAVARRNIFYANETAIMCSTIAGGKGGEATPGEPVLDTNLFAQNRDVMAVMAEKKPAPAGSLSDDPKFRDAAKVDFALQADSPARTAGVGAAEPLAPAGPWPLLAEEEAIIPAGETRDYQHWNSSDTPKTAQAKADTGVPRFDDAALREAALERIRAALKNGDLDKARVSTEVLARLLPAPSSAKTFREKLSKGAENVTDLFLEAYLNCQDAEKARQAGNPSAARAAYQAAITILDSITAKWPDWSPAIVKHRRTKAEEALKKLAAE